MTLFIAFLAAGAAFLILDLLWLGLLARGFYKKQMGELMARTFNVPAAIAFYLVYLVGVMIYAVTPAMETGTIFEAAKRGAMFGFFCYATYDLTCLAVMRNYKTSLAIVDIIWGTILTAAAASAGYYATTLL